MSASCRTLLSVLLGLVLLLQGFALSAAPLGLPDAEMTQAAADTPPCHGAQPPQTDADGSTLSCCDADCPDMTRCALGHFAAAPQPAAPGAHAPVTPRPEASAIVAPERRAASLLRPPITFHG